MFSSLLLAGSLGAVLSALAQWGLRRWPPARRRLPAGFGSLRDGYGVATVIATGLLFAVVVWRFGVGAEAAALLFLVLAGVLLSFIDLRHALLPDVIVLPSIVIGFALLAVAALSTGHPDALLRSLAGGAVLFVVYLILALISPRGLGMGDVKFAAVIGLYLGYAGWRELLLGAAAGFTLAAATGLVLLALRRVSRTTTVPFGPFMLAGALSALAVI